MGLAHGSVPRADSSDGACEDFNAWRSGRSSSPRTVGGVRLSLLGCAFTGTGVTRQVELTQCALCLVPEVFGRGQALPQRVGAAGDGSAAGGPFLGELCVQGCVLIQGFCEGLAIGVSGVGGLSARLFREAGVGSASTTAGLYALAEVRPVIIRHARKTILPPLGHHFRCAGLISTVDPLDAHTAH